jgi:crotonobetainyl-CoA:carnitine CoA-transferase CaiB-like acyl-CoA transferase
LQHSTAPPYLPFAGISFAQYIATASVAMLRKAENQGVQIEQTLYLKDITEFIFNSLHSEQVSSPNKFLHNGAFPCYQVYKSKDEQYLCLAAVEEKYWNNLQSAFDIHLDSEDRFDTSGKTTNTLKKLFAKLDSDEIRELIKETKTCLTIVIN